MGEGEGGKPSPVDNRLSAGYGSTISLRVRAWDPVGCAMCRFPIFDFRSQCVKPPVTIFFDPCSFAYVAAAIAGPFGNPRKGKKRNRKYAGSKTLPASFKGKKMKGNPCFINPSRS